MLFVLFRGYFSVFSLFPRVSKQLLRVKERGDERRRQARQPTVHPILNRSSVTAQRKSAIDPAMEVTPAVAQRLDASVG